ncbi:cycloserine biosynthesis protein DcsG-like [Periplaneta americana]|uniref:cycloserine biosynthesis protein DcsG-like n=1 Tax=Periplaneta americana TaxID=6978 RepID=UPI0037E7E32E
MKIAVVRHSGPEHTSSDIVAIQGKMSDAGFECDVQDWDDPHVRWSQYSMIILTSLVDYVEQAEEFLLWVKNLEASQNPCRLRNNPRMIRWNCNKKYLLDLESRGIRIPVTIWLDPTCTEKEDIGKKIHNGLQKYGGAVKEIIVKNIVGAGGEEVWKCETNDGRALDKIQQQLMSPGGRFGVMVQQFLPEILTYGEWSLIYFDKEFSHAAIKKPAANQTTEFRVQNHYGGTFEIVSCDRVPKALIDFGHSVISTVEDDLLYARVDVVMLADNTPCLMELEVLDCFLFLSEPSHMDKYFSAILRHL